MKIKKLKGGGDARTVLLRVVADTTVCGPVAAKWDGQLFASRPENLIAGWAVKHYKKYNKAPRHNIKGYYDQWAAKEQDEEVQEHVGGFLEALSEELKLKRHISTPVVLDLAADLFDRVKIEKMTEEVKQLAGNGNIAKAWKVIHHTRKVEVGTTSGLDLFAGGAVARNAIRSRSQAMLKWDQEAMRRFLADSMARDEFITFVGPEKAGKSFWLQECAYQGATSNCNVAFFETGDQSQNQIIRRFAARAAGRPFKDDRLVKMPKKILTATEEEPLPQVIYEEETFGEPMTPREASMALKRIGRLHGKGRLKLSVHPNSSLSMAGIEMILDEWKRADGWVPDIVIIDYMDILAPMEAGPMSRDQINESWKAARRLNQKMHCLMITATQANADSYDAVTIDKGNFSEDKRKNAHVTGAIGINQTPTEKEHQLYRLNWLLARDLEFGTSTCVWTAACLAKANPCVVSTF